MRATSRPPQSASLRHTSTTHTARVHAPLNNNDRISPPLVVPSHARAHTQTRPQHTALSFPFCRGRALRGGRGATLCGGERETRWSSSTPAGASSCCSSASRRSWSRSTPTSPTFSLPLAATTRCAAATSPARRRPRAVRLPVSRGGEEREDATRAHACAASSTFRGSHLNADPTACGPPVHNTQTLTRSWPPAPRRARRRRRWSASPRAPIWSRPSRSKGER